MNKFNSVPLVIMLLTAFFATDVFAQRGRGRGRQGNQGTGSYQQGGQNSGYGQNAMSSNGNGQAAGGVLSDVERQGLLLMREEEKLARDVYLAMQEQWGERVFGNIAQAESRHMSALANLLSRYGIPDPITDNTPGVFPTAKFQVLYRVLVETGSKSLSDAFRVGLKIEELDIYDLRVAIRATDNRDINRVFENLERGSRNHLRAFASRLNSTGGTYTATDLSQREFDQIANSQQERGGSGKGRNGSGQRNGRGQGRGRGNNSRR